jgi:aspartyl protease family protein
LAGSASSAILALAAVALLFWGTPTVGGMPVAEVVPLLFLGAAVLWLTGWAVERGRSGFRDAIGAVVMWSIFVASAAAVYVKRDAAAEGLRSFVEELGYGPPSATVSEGGEVTITRRRDGHFRFEVDVNGKSAPFMFDTGASSIVLTAETARMVGFRPEDLRFTAPVQTANGRSLTAPVVLDRLAVGPIAFTRVSALVAKPGVLNENLFGQSVMSRLESYEVRGNRLVLRARKG